MADMVTLYHPELDETKEVPAGSVSVLKKSGWTEEKSDSDASTTDASEPSGFNGEEL